MRILAILNVSSAETIAADSGFIMLRLLVREFTALGHECHVVVPPFVNELLFKGGDAHIHHVDLGRTKYRVRLSLPWEEIDSVLDQVEPDIILNNQIEIAAALRAMMVSRLHSGTRLISYCHYIPAYKSQTGELTYDPSQNDGELCRSLFHHIVSGVLASDITFVQSDYAKDLLTSVGREVGEDLGRKLQIASPPFDDFMTADTTFMGQKVQRENIALYNHRLYEHYGTRALIGLLPKLNKATGCEIHIADPMYLRSAERASADPSPGLFRQQLSPLPYVTLLDGGDDRGLYRSWVERSLFAIAAMRANAVWSMSAVDCLGMGTPVIAPRLAAYPEFIPNMLLFNTTEDAIKIAKALKYEPEFWEEARIASIKSAERYSSKLVASSIIGSISS